MDTKAPTLTPDIEQMVEDAVPPPSCEWMTTPASEPCGAPATWIMSASCGHSSYYDDEHVEKLREQGVGDESTGPTFCANGTSPRHARMLRVFVRYDRITS